MSNTPVKSFEDDFEDVGRFSETDSTHFSSGHDGDDERDEVTEVKKMSQKDTSRVIFWRFAATTVLLLTAVAVTLTTYKFLIDGEEEDFETAFDQFARALGDAAVEQQNDIRAAFRQFANSISAYAQTNNKTWPLVTLPFFQSYGEHTLIQSGTEIFNVFMRVEHEERETYTDYTGDNHEAWVKEGHMLRYGNLDLLNPVGYHPYISNSLNGTGFWPDIDRDYYFCAWHMSPPPTSYGLLNWNIASYRHFDLIFQGVIELKNESLVSPVGPYVAVPTALTQEEHDAMHSKLTDSNTQNPHSFVYTPIHKVVGDYASEIVAIIGSGTAWDAALLNLLPDSVVGFLAVIMNDCNQSYTYEISGKDAIYLGEGDQHEEKYDHMEVIVDLAVHTHPNFTSTPGHCQYSMHLYPTSTFRESYNSTTPELFALVVAFTFGLVAVVFFVYDLFVQRRNNRLIMKAAKSNAIVSSMFPSNIRDKLIGNDEDTTQKKGKGNLKTFMADNASNGIIDAYTSKPLADLFLETTVMFADISGFTAWSSSREPGQVLTLLENIYQAFDAVTRRRHILKVETVGDCYVAISGIPDPRKDHAIATARFARDIMMIFGRLTKELEVTLGPDTGDLLLRIGLHSGPVTGGVLRGERARFQLFGDTVNTTARIEETGEGGRIHLSKDTAELVMKAGKTHWLQKRANTVSAKGKGELETYWLLSQNDDGGSVVSGRHATPDIGILSASMRLPSVSRASNSLHGIDPRTLRLVDWIVECLATLLRKVVARRIAVELIAKQSRPEIMPGMVDGKTFLEEVKEIVVLPEFDSKAHRQERDSESIVLPQAAVEQLREYVARIATMYRNNPFHNFEHASHVMMSVIKLLSRIVAPAELDVDETVGIASSRKFAASLHDHTYGITSDPLTQFACAFSALIHDVDHTGVGNPQLVKENAEMGKKFKERSVAEQNSLEISWNLLMDNNFVDLRDVIYTTDDELIRFRQLVINSVMATDIMDKDLKTMRNDRWDVAFKLGGTELERDAVNRKATIVIEHLIQASDVAHTMQHWHVYRKWNHRLFEELYAAYKAGRAGGNPADFWAKGELGFFDFYIIPLAKKLKDCGVFGKSSDEYLNYAQHNRAEWEKKGEQIVAEMVEKCNQKLGEPTVQTPE